MRRAFVAQHVESSFAMKNNAKTNPSIALDAIRGIAALAVFGSHWRELFLIPFAEIKHHTPFVRLLYGVTDFGHEAVIIFFVMSGYLVGGSAFKAIVNGKWTWKKYSFDRLTRLYIVLLPALLLGYAIDTYGIHRFGEGGIYGGLAAQTIVQHPVAANLAPGIFLANGLFLQTIRSPALGSNGPLWSLANEFWYYILFPCVALAFVKNQKAALRALYAFAFCAILIFVGWNISLYFLVWLLGLAIALSPPVPSPAIGRVVLAAASILLLTVLLGMHHFLAKGASRDFVLAIFSAGFFYAVIQPLNFDWPAALPRIAKHLAASSYTLYLVHLPLLVLLEAALIRGRWYPDVKHIALAFLVLALVFVYAQFIYFLFEKRTDFFRAALKTGVAGERKSTITLAE
jgi:peptidoglycan/LPS O-acetylase OafA/YrhL